MEITKRHIILVLFFVIISLLPNIFVIGCDKENNEMTLNTMFFPVVKDIQQTYATGYTEGVLTLDGKCLRIIYSNGEVGPIPIWPYRYSFNQKTNEVIDANGFLVVRVGDYVQLGGGEIPASFAEEKIGYPIPTECKGSYFLTSGTVKKQPSDTAINIKGMSQNYSLEKLIESSDLIVRGKITKILPSLKGTEGPLNIIYTDLIFEISDSIYGDSQFHNIAIRLWGRRIEKEVAVVDWEPVLNVGEDVVLFLFIPPNDIQPIPEGFSKNNYYKITGSLSGKWVVTGDEITNRKFESKYDLSILRQKIADIRDTK